MILRVGLEVLGEIGDPPAQDRDLDLGGSRVCLRAPVIADQLGLVVFRECHMQGEGYQLCLMRTRAAAAHDEGPKGRADRAFRRRP